MKQVFRIHDLFDVHTIKRDFMYVIHMIYILSNVHVKEINNSQIIVFFGSSILQNSFKRFSVSKIIKRFGLSMKKSCDIFQYIYSVIELIV